MLDHTRECGQNGSVFEVQNLRMGVKRPPKNLRMDHNFNTGNL